MSEAPFTERNCVACGRMFPAYGGHRKCLLCRRTKRPAVGWDARVGRRLSFREQQVAELVARAMVNKEIACELKLTEGTIKEYLHHMFFVLGGKIAGGNRVGLAVWWITEGRAEYQAVQTSANPEAA